MPIRSHVSMFNGLSHTTHQVTQANSKLDERFVTFAEYLTHSEYKTVGLCNNPLLGLINNNLRGGFQEFYN